MCAVRRYRGAETKTCASITAATVNGNRIPSRSSGRPRNPLRPKANSRAIPAISGGSTRGTSSASSTHVLPRKLTVPKT